MKDILSLRKRVGILLLATAVVMGGGMFATLLAMAHVRETVDVQLDVYDPGAVVVRNLLAAGIDQETAVRGYALTGDSRFLEPYDEGTADMNTALARLHELFGEDQIVSERLRVAEQVLIDWRSSVAEPQIQSVRSGGSDTSLAVSDDARAKFSEFRAKWEDLRLSVTNRRTETREALDEGEQRLMVLLGAATLLFVLLGVGVWVLLRRWVTGPIARLGVASQAVANGELSHQVSVSGPAELQQLGRDVEAMRTRILDELNEVRAARERLDVQATELARSNADLEQFAYVASHDLQEPLRKVASFCQLLDQRYSDKLDDAGHQYIEFAVDGAKRMQQLINDLLSFSRVGRNVVAEPVPLDEVVGHATRTLERVIEEAGATVTADPLPTVEGDPTLLVALFQNLIGNAVKFRTPDVPPHVRISAVRDGEFWSFTVADNGIGIEPEYADKVFIIFQRLHGRDEFEGTGIGLSLCKKIVEHHGGVIWLDTEVSEGTAVRFTLPAKVGNPLEGTAP